MRSKQLVIAFSLCSAATFGQVPSTRPIAAAPGTQPAGVDEAFSARVIEVSGGVSYSLTGAGGERGAWQAAKVGDVLPAGTRIRTQIRARLGLAFGDDTVVVIERATLASIDQFHRSGDTKKIQLGLGHGTIRAGVAETTLRSDMTIETPTATLSKRGTQDFGISYEPSSGRYRIWLAKEGLVEAINNLTGSSRLVRPGQYVTEAMLRWIQTATLDRWVPIVDTFGTTNLEKAFHAFNNTGLAVVDPGGGSTIYTLAGRDAAQIGSQFGQRPLAPTVITPGGGTSVIRPEGNFGTGSGGSFPGAKRR